VGSTCIVSAVEIWKAHPNDVKATITMNTLKTAFQPTSSKVFKITHNVDRWTLPGHVLTVFMQNNLGYLIYYLLHISSEVV